MKVLFQCMYPRFDWMNEVFENPLLRIIVVQIESYYQDYSTNSDQNEENTKENTLLRNELR